MEQPEEQTEPLAEPLVPEPPQVEGKKPPRRKNYALEAACVTLAKGSCPRGAKVTDVTGARMNWTDRKNYHDTQTKKALCNCIAKLSADYGEMEKAEQWMMKLEGVTGCEPEAYSFNAIITAATKMHDLAKADEWFAKAEELLLHPQLHGLQPNPQSYDIMVRACAEQGDISRAEKYVQDAERKLACRPTLLTICALVRACLDKGETRRAHLWLADLVENGCAARSDYSSNVVRAEHDTLRSQRSFDVEKYRLLVIAVLEALARQGNSATADGWLKYLAEGGLRYKDAREAWETVRSVSWEIVPAVLSGESDRTQTPMSPPLRRPATLSGERRGGGGNKSLGTSRGTSRASSKSQFLPWEDGPLTARPSTTGRTGRSVLAIEAGRGRPKTSQGFTRDPKTGVHVLETPDGIVELRHASTALKKILYVKARGATLDTSSFNKVQGLRGVF
eukprot:TRINITY_DN105014_c0_g1_i1.p1 TRINITY_DN105014_c0_g1~~TRINITY_DN105014_c0_g1_i1.p1  ORF type:complete len:449 (-),score=80.27 TRINITY_DN105014_c0_g1_i1:68-1414(-)